WTGSVTFGGTNRPNYIGHYWFKNDGTAPFTGVGAKVTEGMNVGGFLEVKIPRADIGSPANGTTIGIIVGFRPAEDKSGFTDIAPYKVGAVNDWGNSASAVDPAATDYINYTF
ncbi:MAG TPA: hypothetical protein PK771_14780, partial [Spirochaetota bacterium]|nr:hypothetical protein [Spirochaetota bacterium]